MIGGWSESDYRWMRRAIDLARPHRTHPNPKVGCVVVDTEGKNAGEGAHDGVGTPHAEAVALTKAGVAAYGSTVYVTLEPCVHFGHTPPCSDALIEASVGRVVIAVPDPDERVNGRGVSALQQAGIKVEVGLMADMSIRLDPGFHHHRKTGRPHVRGILLEEGASHDPSVRNDLERMTSEADCLFDRVTDPVAELASLAAEGKLTVVTTRGATVNRLRREGLLDALTHYTKGTTSPDDQAGPRSGFHTVAVRRIGSGYLRVDLAADSTERVSTVRRESEATIPTSFGTFRAIGFESQDDGHHHLALVMGQVEGDAPPLVRIHSECLTGDVFGSLRCDCGFQLEEALKRIGLVGRGLVLYMRGHEGRGIGLIHKLAAYGLQDQGRDTAEANLDLGFPVDARDYGVGAQMLLALGVRSVRLLTNNPAKQVALRASGITVAERVPIIAGENAHNRSYLRTKADKLGHILPDTGIMSTTNPTM